MENTEFIAVKEFMPIDDIKNYILSNYNLTIYDIENIKFKDTDKQRAVYKVNTNRGAKCLKKVYYSEEILLFIYSVIEWLNARGILAPRLISTKKGLKYVKHNDNLFILTDWVEGKKCDYDSIQDIVLVSENLAKIHLYSKNFKPIEGSKCVKGICDFYESQSKHFMQLLETSNIAFATKDNFSKLFLEHFDYNIEAAQKSVSILSSINFHEHFGDEVSTNAICHLDYVNKNLIITPESKIYVIDFDRCEIDYPIHDICSFLKRILKRSNTMWNFDILKKSIESYETIRKLSYNEYIAIYALLMFPQKYWKISRDYYKNKDKCNKNAFNSILKKITNQDNAHEKFCNKFDEYINIKFGG